MSAVGLRPRSFQLTEYRPRLMTAKEHVDRAKEILAEMVPDYEAVIRELQWGLQANPEREIAFKLHFELGIVFRGLQRFEEAEQAYVKALTFASEGQLPIIYTNLGAIFYSQKREKEAIESIKKAKDCFPDNDGKAVTVFNFALMNYNKRMIAQAKVLFQEVLELIELDSHHVKARVHYFLAEIAYKEGNYSQQTLDEIEAGLRMVKDATTEAQLHLTKCRVWIQQSNLKEALAACEAGLKVAPEGSDVHKELVNEREYFNDNCVIL